MLLGSIEVTPKLPNALPMRGVLRKGREEGKLGRTEAWLEREEVRLRTEPAEGRLTEAEERSEGLAKFKLSWRNEGLPPVDERAKVPRDLVVRAESVRTERLGVGFF